MDDSWSLSLDETMDTFFLDGSRYAPKASSLDPSLEFA